MRKPEHYARVFVIFLLQSNDYADTPKLSGAAKKYYRTYKKLFDEFSARNAQNNANENSKFGIRNSELKTNSKNTNDNSADNTLLSTKIAENSQKTPLTNINQGNMHVSGREYVSYARKVLDTIRKAIQTKGKLDSDYNQVKISKVTPKMAKMVKSASGGSIDISKKYVALNGFDLWHEYKRHSDAANEVGRRQIPLTPEKMQEAIMAIYEPEIVESVFVTKNNPVQKQSFAYAKRSSDGHYVVVEAVGGKKKPNITPAMVLEFTPEKWKEMIDSDKTLGEILYETDEEMKSALDVEYNKKNRVTAAQFASSEAIANTPHSPRFNNSISQKSANSNPSGEKNSEKSSGKDFALDIDSETGGNSGTEVMSWLKDDAKSVGNDATDKASSGAKEKTDAEKREAIAKKKAELTEKAKAEISQEKEKVNARAEKTIEREQKKIETERSKMRADYGSAGK